MQISAIVSVKDLESGETLNTKVNNISDKDHFSYDDEGVFCTIDVFEDGVEIVRQLGEGTISIALRPNGYARVNSPEGRLDLPTKIVAYKKINDIVFIAYTIADQNKEFEIKYIGELNDQKIDD